MTVTTDQPIQRQAQALGDPTRFAIFEHVANSPDPIGVAELTERMGFNHNAIRQHLAKLVDADLVVESTEPRTTPGRPRLAYQARTDAFDRFQNRSGGSYQRLATMLLDLAATGDTPYEVGRRSAQCTELDEPTDDDGTIEAVMHRLDLDGFAPSRDESTVRLDRCPFAELASDNAAVVCELHRGLIDGCLEQLSDTTTVALTPKPPATAGCLVAFD